MRGIVPKRGVGRKLATNNVMVQERDFVDKMLDQIGYPPKEATQTEIIDWIGRVIISPKMAQILCVTGLASALAVGTSVVLAGR